MLAAEREKEGVPAVDLRHYPAPKSVRRMTTDGEKILRLRKGPKKSKNNIKIRILPMQRNIKLDIKWKKECFGFAKTYEEQNFLDDIVGWMTKECPGGKSSDFK